MTFFCLILFTKSQIIVVFVISLFIFYYSHAGFELHIWPMHFLTFTKKSNPIFKVMVPNNVYICNNRVSRIYTKINYAQCTE